MENSGGSRGKGECPSRLRKRLRQALASSDWPIKRPKRDRRRQRGLEGSNVGPHPMPSHSHSLPPMLKVSLYFPPLAYPLYELMPIPPARPLRELKRSLADLSTGSLHAPDISFWLGDRLCGDDELVGELWAQQVSDAFCLRDLRYDAAVREREGRSDLWERATASYCPMEREGARGATLAETPPGRFRWQGALG